ncbi:MAG: extracellular solute-binding protein [bacterium]
MYFKKMFISICVLLVVIFVHINVNAENDEISIYYEGHNLFSEAAIKRFENIYPDVEVKENVAEMQNFSDFFNNKEKLVNDLLSGNSSDIMIVNRHTFDRLFDLIKEGVFYDLNEIITSDLVDLDKLNPVVYDGGMIYGKRYFIPLSYSLPIYISTREILEKNNISLSDFDYSQKELVEHFIDYLSKDSENYINIYPDVWLEASGFYNISYDNYRIATPEEQLLRFIESVKKFSKLKYDNSSLPDDLQMSEMELLNNEIVLADRLAGVYQDPRNILFLYNSIKSKTGQHMQLLPLPMANDTAYISTPEDIVLVSVTAENKESIANFISVLLSEEIQQYHISNLPINKKAMDYNIDLAKNQSGEDEALHELLDGLKYITDNIKYCNINDQTLFRLLIGVYINYRDGKISNKEFIEEVNFEIQKYFME